MTTWTDINGNPLNPPWTSSASNDPPFSAINTTYQPAGTGAVATTVQAKLRESVSVLDFGADPTGVIDASASIQAAINSMSVNAGGGDFHTRRYL